MKKKKHSIHHNQNCKLFEIRNKNKKQQQKQQVNYEIVLTEKKNLKQKKRNSKNLFIRFCKCNPCTYLFAWERARSQSISIC